MNMESPASTVSAIINLPNEIVSLILVNNEPRDIISFGATCKQFHELVSNDDLLWKKKLSQTLPNKVVKLIKERKNGKWLKELINFYNLKQNVCTELIRMPSEYHRRVKEVSLSDVEIFFTYAAQNNLNYYYTISILQEIVKKGNAIIDTQQCLKPLYTLTTIYYAKIVLRHLLHMYLAMKWLQKYVRMELTPEFVINFFLQWIDVTEIYSDEEVDKKIQSLVTRVKEFLEETHSKSKLEEHTERKKFTERQLLHAISKVIFSTQHKVSTEADTNTFNIVKVIDDNYGHLISYGTIYQAVAKRFGLKCELIAFPQHLFLEWQSRDEPNQLYTIDLHSGEVKPKRRCPFSSGPDKKYEYCPDSFLQFIYSTYMGYAGQQQNCESDNAIQLSNFFGTDENSPNLNYYDLLKYAHLQPIVTTLNLTYLENEQIEMILELSTLKKHPGVDRKLDIKKRNKAITYAVGMVCYHNIYHYICVIRGWEANGKQLQVEGAGKLRGRDQPFYCVMAADQSERLVAQENLNVVLAPLRLKNLEDRLAREFTHFDGMAYVPNEEKLLEYPDEELYIEAFRKSSFVQSRT